MKRIVLLLLCVMLITPMLCGCKKVVDASAEKAAQTENQTEAPTEAPTAAPTEAPTQAITPVDASWFDDAVFIGDSITLALDYACADDPTMLGNAKFVCAQSLGYHNALWGLDDEGAVHPTYQGKTILSETAAEVTGATKVFILLGVNDIGTYGAEDTMESAKELAQRILSHSPDVTLYFQSTTPMIADQESDWLNNDKITDFDNLLKAYCEEQGYYYIDVYHQVCDADGKLNPDYCGDPEVQGIHFNTDGCTIWANYLKTFVASPGSISNAAAPTTAATEAPAQGADTGEGESNNGAYTQQENDGYYEEEQEDINYYVSE